MQNEDHALRKVQHEVENAIRELDAATAAEGSEDALGCAELALFRAHDILTATPTPAPINNEALVEEVARAISGAPFPSKASFRKARAVLALPSIAQVKTSRNANVSATDAANPAQVQSALVEEAIGALERSADALEGIIAQVVLGPPLAGLACDAHDDSRATLAKLKEGRA